MLSAARSSPVNTATTPAMARAASTPMPSIFAWACGEAHEMGVDLIGPIDVVRVTALAR